MFGYIRPVKGELKVREFESFKSCYCGLCHTLGRRYGVVSRFILNFDFVFLAMLLWEDDGQPQTELRRCPVSPFRGKRCCKDIDSRPLDRCAGYSVILAYWKTRDSLRDERGFSRLLARGALAFLRGPYKKAARLHPVFDGRVRDCLRELNAIESAAGAGSTLDEAADKFARILSAASDTASPSRVRALEQLLYHAGRWIYILDACDDVKDDAERGRFNPVSARFGLTGGSLDAGQSEHMRLTLTHSSNLAGAAFELLGDAAWSSVIRNIICLGMPAVCSSVLAGTWRAGRRTSA